MKIQPGILLYSLFCSIGLAQNPDALFNPAAKEYIYGNTTVASNLVNQALTEFPNDEKLQKLKKLIEEQQQQQQQQNQQQQDQQDQQDQNQEQQDQQDQKDSQDQQQNEPQKPDQKEQPKQDSADPNKEQPQKQPAQPRKAGEMSPQEAQQLLDAMKQNEKDQRANLRPYLGQPVRVNKDW